MSDVRDPRAHAVAELATAWRRDLHAHPELNYDLPRTSAFVAEQLTAFGCDRVETGIGRSGVVATITGRKGTSDRVLGLRADMDALPILEATGAPYASKTPGKMHACGHDGHTAMLLAAAKALSQTRDFAGTVALVFQPAEEGGAGAAAMLKDGLIERFGIQEIFGVHTMPGMPLGAFGLREGPMMASADLIHITVTGDGGHAAIPHLAIDPVLAASQVVVALQSIVARNVDPLQAAVVSVTTFHAGSADNVIPNEALLSGTARALTPQVRDLLEARIAAVASGIAAAYGATAETRYTRGYPMLANIPAQVGFARAAAASVVGDAQVSTDFPPIMGAEDFAFYLERIPGAFMFLGNGDSAGLHHPAFDFDDRAIPVGVAYWLALAESRLGV